MAPLRRTQAPAAIRPGFVHCPMCTHNVQAEVVQAGARTYVKPGQKCARCAAALDAAFVLQFDRAA